jgi:hypothetical protein
MMSYSSVARTPPPVDRRTTRRLMLAAAVALVLTAMTAAPWRPAGAATAAAANAGKARAVAARAFPALVLKGKTTRKIPWNKLPTKVSWDGAKAGNINPSLLAVYKGQTLFKLVGLVDGGSAGFNVALARKGYTIQLICSDGYTAKLSSKQIVGKTHWIIAKLKNGQPLPAGEAPYRFVGSFIKPFNGKLSAFKIVQIKLVF